MSKRSSAQLIEDMLLSISRIATYSEGLSEASFRTDTKSSDAVVRNIEIIGEAAARLPASLRIKASDVPWPLILGMRNRIVHEYFGVDLGIVWHVVTVDMPELKSRLEALLESIRRNAD